MVSDPRILFVAAEPREFDGLLRFCSRVRKLAWPLDWARGAELSGRHVWMVANGAGAARAARAVDVAFPASQRKGRASRAAMEGKEPPNQSGAGRPFCAVHGEPEAIVSMGFCGALDPALVIGDVFVATRIACANQRKGRASRATIERTEPQNHSGAGRPFCAVPGENLEVCLPRTDAAHSTGVLASIDHVAQTAAEKASLRASGASAVEMEAAGVAERAAAYGVPLFCVKSVTDTAGENFTIDFNQALLSGGHFGTIRILRSALGNPGAAFPELIRLRHSCRIAARKLGEFIVACRF